MVTTRPCRSPATVSARADETGAGTLGFEASLSPPTHTHTPNPLGCWEAGGGGWRNSGIEPRWNGLRERLCVLLRLQPRPGLERCSCSTRSGVASRVSPLFVLMSHFSLSRGTGFEVDASSGFPAGSC